MNDKSENKFLAHVRQDKAGIWHEHLLDEHLYGVAVMAADFAVTFESSDWANVAGIWHDLGKYSDEFQHYIKKVSGYANRYDAEAHIEGKVGRVDHSTAGAIRAMRQLGAQGRILAYLIAGHHAGLPDWSAADTCGQGTSHPHK